MRIYLEILLFFTVSIYAVLIGLIINQMVIAWVICVLFGLGYGAWENRRDLLGYWNADNTHSTQEKVEK